MGWSRGGDSAENQLGFTPLTQSPAGRPRSSRASPVAGRLNRCALLNCGGCLAPSEPSHAHLTSISARPGPRLFPSESTQTRDRPPKLHCWEFTLRGIFKTVRDYNCRSVLNRRLRSQGIHDLDVVNGHSLGFKYRATGAHSMNCSWDAPASRLVLGLERSFCLWFSRQGR
jgi:hypothetical protein